MVKDRPWANALSLKPVIWSSGYLVVYPELVELTSSPLADTYPG